MSRYGSLRGAPRGFAFWVAVAMLCVGLPVAALAASNGYAAEEPEQSLTIDRIDDLFGHVPAKRTFASPDRSEFSTISGYAQDQLPNQALAAQQAAVAAATDHENFLSTPGAEAARDASLSAFKGLGHAQALALTQEHFGDQIEAVSATPADTLIDDEIIKFRGDDVALVDPAGPREKELVVSTLPLRARGSNGILSPVDTTLERESDSWVPANPVIDSSLPQSSDGSIKVAGLGLSVPTDDNGSSSLSLDDAARFYPGTADDTDMTVSSLTSGVEIFFTLRSPDSPENHVIDFDLPSGYTLEPQANGSIAVVNNGHRIVSISPPTSTDAQGSEVPTTAQIDGDSIVVHADHVGHDFAYPILVDPLVEKATPMPVGVRPVSSVLNEQFGLMWPDGGWYQLDNGVPIERYGVTGSHGGGLYLSDPATGHSSTGGMWMWMPPPGASDLTQVDFGPYDLDLNGDGLDVGGAAVMGMYNAAGIAAHSVVAQTSAGYASLDVEDAYGDPQAIDAAVFGLFRIRFGTPTHEEDHHAFLGGAVAHYTDPEGAVLYGDFGQLDNPTMLDGWTHENGEVSFPLRAADYGLGVKAMAVYMEDDEENITLLGSYIDPCDGTPESPCPERLNHDVSVDFSEFDEGEEYTLKFRAFDALGETNGGLDATIGVDRTSPVLEELDGELVDLKDTYSDNSSNVDLIGSASDEEAATNSGLKKITASDDTGAWTDVANCDEVDCDSHEFQVPLGLLSDGNVKVTVSAEDHARNVVSRNVSLKLDRSAPDVAISTGSPSDSLGPAWARGDELKFGVSINDVPVTGPGVDEYSVTVDGDPVDPEPCATECPELLFVIPDVDPGAHTVAVEATDHLGHTTEKSAEIVLDNESPEIEVSGELEDGASVGYGTQTVQIDVDEPTGATDQSGPTEMSVEIDGKEAETFKQTCDDGDCPISKSYSFAEDELSLGQHSIKVIAHDGAGNTSEQTVSVRRVCEVPTPTTVSTSDPITTSAAVNSVENNHPNVVATSETVEKGDLEFTPTLAEDGDVLKADDTAQPSQHPENSDGAMVVGMDEQAICLVPKKRSNHADDAVIVNDDSALYANTAQDVDTVVRPTVDGAEDYSLLRSEDAPEEFDWTVGSSQDTTLDENPNGTVSVNVDGSDLPIPEKPLDMPALPGQASELVTAGELPAGTTDAEDDHEGAQESAIQSLVRTRPDDNDVSEALSSSGPAGSFSPPSSGDPDAEDAEDALEAARSEALEARNTLIEESKGEFADSEADAIADANDAAEEIEENSAAGVQSSTVEIAKISAPDAKDATGEPVPVDLSASTDSVQMSVEHHGEGYEYPIAADPAVSTLKTIVEWEPYPVYRDETYVSGQEIAFKQVGWWDAKYCQWITCTAAGTTGWYVAGAYLIWLPDGPSSSTVGPMFSPYLKPIFATRTVLDHWGEKQVLRQINIAGYEDEAVYTSFSGPGGAVSSAHTSSDSPRKVPDGWERGMNVVSFTPGGFGFAASNNSKTALSIRNQMAIRTVVAVPVWGTTWLNTNQSIGDPGGNKVLAQVGPIRRTGKTNEDPGLRDLLRDADDKNMRSVIKPHVDLYYGGGKDGPWRGYATPSNPDDFFDSYTNMMVNYAVMAANPLNHVDGLVIETEFKYLQNMYPTKWNDLIDAIRNHYGGRLYVASNYDGIDNPPSWFKRIDVLGFDYYPDPDYNQPSKPNAVTPEIMWQKIVNLHGRYPDKPIILTETGAEAKKQNGRTQQEWYEKLLNVFTTKAKGKNWFDGMWWYSRLPGTQTDDWTTGYKDGVGGRNVLCKYQAINPQKCKTAGGV